jgi:hypothetical protein
VQEFGFSFHVVLVLGSWRSLIELLATGKWVLLVSPVAQTSSLLYRGFPIRKRRELPAPQDWKSAIQQVGNVCILKVSPRNAAFRRQLAPNPAPAA